MTGDAPHFAAAVSAFAAALQDRVAPGINSFSGLFHEDATIEVPFDGAGNGAPIVGKPAIDDMVRSLAGFLWFDAVTFHSIRATDEPDVVVCEYEAVLRRADMPGPRRRRYISVITFRDRLISRLREYGGPFMPVGQSGRPRPDSVGAVFRLRY